MTDPTTAHDASQDPQSRLDGDGRTAPKRRRAPRNLADASGSDANGRGERPAEALTGSALGTEPDPAVSAVLERSAVAVARADQVEIRRGAACRVEADAVDVIQGAVCSARTDRLTVKMGAVGLAAARRADVSQAWVRSLLAQEVRLEQGVAQSIVANRVTMGHGSGALIVIARRVDGEVRALLDWRGGLALGIGLGFVFAILRPGRDRGRRQGRHARPGRDAAPA